MGDKLLVKIIIEIDNVPDNTEIHEVIGNALEKLGKKVLNGKIKIYEEVG